MSDFIYKNGKKLRCGYTTGSCAAAAAKCASRILLGLNEDASVCIRTPGGKSLELPVTVMERSGSMVLCGVRKDAGDDADVTDGLMICASVTLRPPTGAGLQITGGEGVGRVTRPGLDQPVGEAAINSVPRQMIREALTEAAEEAGYTGGFHVVISAPGGDEIAMRTFNPRLGIEGGISILGTTGIVEPMSTKALLDTIRVEIHQKKTLGEPVLAVAPGNYGKEFMKRTYGYDLERSVACSNFIGDTVDMAREEGFHRMLLTGHIGKLIKVSGGIMNTHSHEADARMELLAAAALRAGADAKTALSVMDAVTTEEGVRLLSEAGILDGAMRHAMEKIQYYLEKRAGSELHIECMMYSNDFGLLAKSSGAEEFLRELTGGAQA